MDRYLRKSLLALAAVFGLSGGEVLVAPARAASPVQPLITGAIADQDAVDGFTLHSIVLNANGALQRSAAGPLATVQGSTAQAAANSAIGFAPYPASNPSGFITSAQVSSMAGVQSVAGSTGVITNAQLAAALTAQDISKANIGNGHTGTQIQASQATDEGNISSLTNQLSSVQGTASAALPRSASGPLATVQGSSAQQAVNSAIGFTPYPASNPSNYVTSAQVSNLSGVQSVGGATGVVTGAQIAGSLTGQDVSKANVGGSQTGAALSSTLATAASNITTLQNNVASLQNSSSSAIHSSDVGNSVAGLSGGNITNDVNQPNALQNLQVSPTGNTIKTYSSLNYVGSAKSSSNRDFMVNLGFSSNLGGGTTGADKVNLYAGMLCYSGSGNCWAQNLLVDSETGYNGIVQGSEIDVNNQGPDAGFGQAHQAWGLDISGTASNLMTGGMFISGPNSPIWHVGVAVLNNSVADESFDDQANGNFGYVAAGTHAYSGFLSNGSGAYGFQATGNYSGSTVADTAVTPISYSAEGHFSFAALFTGNATTSQALVVAGGQRICLNGSGSACIYYRAASQQIIVTDNSGTAIMAISHGGNLAIAGVLSQNTGITP